MVDLPQYSKGVAAALDEFEIDMDDLDLFCVVGEGAFGKVYKAAFRVPSDKKERQQGKPVAVKVLKGSVTHLSKVLIWNLLKTLSCTFYFTSLSK